MSQFDAEAMRKLATIISPRSSQAISECLAEIERLRGLQPEIPQRPLHNNDASHQHPALPRYGLRWNGPGQPASVPMADGYWTPFHMALAALSQPAPKPARPPCPQEIVDLITAYGDARADQDANDAPLTSPLRLNECIHAIRDALQDCATPEPVVMRGPVAWKWRCIETGAVGCYFENPEAFGIDLTAPGYEWTLLHDAPEPVKVREPMSEEQIASILLALPEKPWGVGSRMNDAIAAARAIERFHGITKESA